MLTGKLVLHDIADVEGFAARIVQRSRFDLNRDEFEQLLTYLIEECWILSVDFRPGARSFSAYAGERLRTRCFDWKRVQGRTRWQFANRTYERTLPVFTTLDDRPDNADSTSTVDVDRVRQLDLGRLLRTRGCGPARRNGEMGTAPDKRAA